MLPMVSVDHGSAEPEARPSRRRRLLFRAGVTCVVVGLVLLGYVAWQMFGTNLLSERLQREEIADIERSWQQPASSTESGTVDRFAPGEGFALVRVPRFGSDYLMPVLEGTDDETLERGFGHFEDSVGPGEAGNFALAAHRVTHGQPLRDMPDLEPGDEVLVETQEIVFTYVIDTDPEDLVVDADDVWVVDDRPVNPDDGGVGPVDAPELLTLTTCAELFHTDDRMIAFGHLVSSAPRASS